MFNIIYRAVESVAAVAVPEYRLHESRAAVLQLLSRTAVGLSKIY